MFELLINTFSQVSIFVCVYWNIFKNVFTHKHIICKYVYSSLILWLVHDLLMILNDFYSTLLPLPWVKKSSCGIFPCEWLYWQHFFSFLFFEGEMLMGIQPNLFVSCQNYIFYFFSFLPVGFRTMESQSSVYPSVFS